MTRAPTVSIVLPCLNEAESVARCVEAAHDVLAANGLEGEVIVVDNGSTDGSPALAEGAGARVVHEPRRGYGSAYLAGFAAAEGDVLVMADADGTYDLADLPRFLAELESGAQFVIGDRMDSIEPGAMPWLHRYVGNPVLATVLNVLFRAGVRDPHCGMRVFRREILVDLDLRTTGMEFASEMVIRAAKEDIPTSQVPIVYRPRLGESKLESFRDGWRHLRFLVVHSPTYLFALPGALMGLLGALMALTVLARIEILGREWDIHALVAGCLLMIISVQVLALGLCARAYGRYFLGEKDPWLDRLRERLRLEHGLLLGGSIVLTGLFMCAVIIGTWIERGFGSLAEERLAVLAATLVIVGVQVFFSSFLLSILGLRRRD